MKMLQSLLKILFLCLIILSCADTEKVNSDNLKLITMSPGITETLFYLGAGKSIIGTSGHCGYPEEAKHIPAVGSISDINYEFVLREKPDAVFLMPSHSDIADKLGLLGIKSVIVPQETLDDILDSFVLVGKNIGREERGRDIKDSLKAVLDSSKKQADSLKVLVCAGREYGSPVSSVYSTGRKGFLNDIIYLLGHENTLETSVPYPKISAETIIALRPDIILDLVYSDGADENKLIKDWDLIKNSKACADSKIVIVTGSRTTIPGPRIFDFIKELKEKGL